MKALFVLNDPLYGSECCYNGRRLANALAKSDLPAPAGANHYNL